MLTFSSWFFSSASLSSPASAQLPPGVGFAQALMLPLTLPAPSPTPTTDSTATATAPAPTATATPTPAPTVTITQTVAPSVQDVRIDADQFGAGILGLALLVTVGAAALVRGFRR